jgi:hypothetical protein
MLHTWVLEKLGRPPHKLIETELDHRQKKIEESKVPQHQCPTVKTEPDRRIEKWEGPLHTKSQASGHSGVECGSAIVTKHGRRSLSGIATTLLFLLSIFMAIAVVAARCYSYGGPGASLH